MTHGKETQHGNHVARARATQPNAHATECFALRSASCSPARLTSWETSPSWEAASHPACRRG
eukprot:4242993-Prymnesium_polylepis.1